MTTDRLPLSPDGLEAALRAIGAERYHDRHPFHHRMRDGLLNRGQIQAWALNRFCYQSAVPRKDAALIARLDDPALRREWRRRLVDHDGEEGDDGGIARWLVLTDALGLDRDMVVSGRAALPATRFAVEAYVRFVAERPVLEAIASSLTELFSPAIIQDRLTGMLANYPFVDRDALAYFDRRLSQAPRDSDFALGYVRDHARAADQQAAVMAALRFKCDVLWALLDALDHAYVCPALPPPGAFRPEPEPC